MKTDIRHTFIASDHHFGEDISKDDELVKKWNSVVKHDDVVIYNGDFADCNLSKIIELKKKLNGKIILIKGNHDVLPDNVYEAVFGEVCSSIFLEDCNIFITHVPDPEILKTHKLIYGHMHIDDGFLDLPKDKSFCSCQMRNDGYPIALSEVLNTMSDNELARKV